jgi:beta-galactosidase/beta-glucuronidase
LPVNRRAQHLPNFGDDRRRRYSRSLVQHRRRQTLESSRLRIAASIRTVRNTHYPSDTLFKRIGFRTCSLVQKPDSNGKSFYFRFNNFDIFCGGSCWIPADSFLSGITSKRYRDWIKLLAASNQVMIRVWGGGVYEYDAFFDACDEFGILVW